MTITYRNGVVLVPRIIKTREITISLTPGTNPKEDYVLCKKREHGDIPVTSEAKGPGINNDTTCKRHGIGWYDPQAESEPRHGTGWFR